MDTSATTHAILLMQDIAEQGELHLRELEFDYTQLRVLLADSVDRIAESFACIATLATPALDSGVQSDNDGGQQLELQDALTRIASHAVEVATELQFHDLASQILARSEGRVHGLSALLGHLRTQAENLSTRSHEPELINDIATTSRLIRECSQELSARLRKTVTQMSLDTGDIELF